VVPIGGMIDFWGASVPSSSFVFPIGQAISRTTYSALFTLFSTTYGTGDGSTTFNVPDVWWPRHCDERGFGNAAYLYILRRHLDIIGRGRRLGESHADNGAARFA
jgi:microcystin-dependent protein